MPSKVIISNIKALKAVEEKLAADIDKIINKIDIKQLIISPEVVMQEINDQIKTLILEKYIDDAIDIGAKFSKDIRKFKVTVEDGTEAEKEEAFSNVQAINQK